MRASHAFLGRALAVLGLVSGLVLGLLFLGACARKAAPRLKIAVTIFPIYDLTRTIAGPDADVILLIPPGISAHDPGAAAPRADAVSGVKLGIMVGLGLDGWLPALLEQAGPSAHKLVVGDRVPTLPISKSAVDAHGAGTDTDSRPEGSPDPHVWLDPERAMLMSKAIAEEMARADSAHASAYRSRSFALQQDLDALDREIEGRVSKWASRSFASFPPEFVYFADRYRLDVTRATSSRIEGLNPVGGQNSTDTYDKLMRLDTDLLERLVAVPPSSPNRTTSDSGGILDR